MELKDKVQFEELTSQDKLTVVDFFATWCGPCKMLAPVLVELAENMGDSINVVKVDIDQYNELASEFRVQSVPTIVYIKNGSEIARTVGYMDIDSLTEKVESLK
ncbi:thioredoxin [Ureaplasma ceti]|uniref:Thioredoxin n=1 Tax=Ureaplasma ceti TaxID=3119530 RepID=A0ABP9U5P2_9BACT